MRTSPIEDRGLLRIEEAADYLGIGRSKAYELLAPHGPIPTVRIGRSLRVPLQALKRWVDEQISAGEPGAEH